MIQCDNMPSTCCSLFQNFKRHYSTMPTRVDLTPRYPDHMIE